jgi:hypothetical protein
VNWVRVIAAALCAMLLVGDALAQGQDQRLWIAFGENPKPMRPTAPIATLQDLMGALRRCFRPPALDGKYRTVDVGFRISFKRSGELFGKPKTLYFEHDLAQERRDQYYQAVAEALDLCGNMPFTDALGHAVAGRVFRVLFKDTRNRIQTEWQTTTTS